MSSWLSALEDVFWPRALLCLCCGMNSGGKLICVDCQRELDALRLPEHTGPDRSVWQYAGCARELVIGLKHECMADCANVLAAEMAGCIAQMHLPADTVLTWVTMPERRCRERGIDHGRTLCEAVAKRVGMPVRCLLSRTAKVHTQQGLDRAARLRNLSGTFCCEGDVPRHVLLIDDVSTTGATAQACREALLQGGARMVYTLTATRVVPDI